MNETNRYAVAIAVGPVSSFISAGRRSRDLWYGSRLLSEMTRRVALFLSEMKRDTGGDTIFWMPLEETIGTGPFFDLAGPDPSDNPPVISNKIRAIISANGEQDIRRILREAEQAARRWLAKQLEKIKDENNDINGVDIRAFQAQADAILAGDFMEYYAGYSRVRSEDNDGESKALERAQELREARKNSRVFVAPSWTEAGHVRSTMEAGRDSVLIQYDLRYHPQKAVEAKLERHRQGIRSDERLDAIALLRRFAAMRAEGEDSEKWEALLLPGLPFAPLSRVAADPWIEGVKASRVQEKLKEIRNVLRGLECDKYRFALHLVSSPSKEPGTGPNRRHEDAIFPYDASLLFDGTLEALKREVKRTRGEFEKAGVRPETHKFKSIAQAQSALRRIEVPLKELHAQFRAPSPYYVLLTADGDGVGAMLSEQKTQEQEHALVNALDEFANNAWRIVKQGRGVAFYVGGDELCAYLPLDKALETACKLAVEFDEVRGRAEKKGAKIPSPLTLSLGLVVAHVKHDLRDVRHRAELALTAAKTARRASGKDVSWIQVNESVAGGGDRKSGGATKEYAARMRDWIDGDDEVSMATAHGLLNELQRLDVPMDPGPRIPDTGALRAGLTLALGAMLQRRRRSGKNTSPQLQSIQKAVFPQLQSHDVDDLKEAVHELRRVAHEIILASRIQAAAKQRDPATVAVTEEKNA